MRDYVCVCARVLCVAGEHLNIYTCLDGWPGMEVCVGEMVEWVGCMH